MLWWTNICNIRKLKSDSLEVRKKAAETLGISGNKKAVEPLINLLKDPYLTVWVSASESLKKIGEPSLGPLLGALDDNNESLRERAASILGEMGDAHAVEPLIRALNDSAWKVRNKAAESLGKLGDTRAVEPLIRAVQDFPGTQVRDTAAESLVRLGDTRAIEPLFRALRDSSGHISATLAEALGRLGDARAIPLLIEGLNDSKLARSRRCYFASSLGRIGDGKSIEPLIAAHKTAVQESLAFKQQHSGHYIPELDSFASSCSEALKAIARRLSEPNETLNLFLQQAGAQELAKSETAARLAQEQKEKEERRVQELIRPIRGMSEMAMISLLQRLCTAYKANDTATIDELEPRAAAIGELLNHRGGIEEMRRIFKKLEGTPGARTLEMHWGGIGEWRG